MFKTYFKTIIFNVPMHRLRNGFPILLLLIQLTHILSQTLPETYGYVY